MKNTIVCFIISLSIILAGCAQEVHQPDESIRDEFYTAITELKSGIGNVEEISQAAAYLKENAEYLTSQDVSDMILLYEDLQKIYLPIVGKDFYAESIQSGFRTAFETGIDYNDPEALPEGQLKSLIDNLRSAGYKAEQAEGDFFPAIDYSFYSDFSSFASPDIQDYIAIMAEESDRPPLKDAALVISWDEVVERGLNQEAFMNQHDGSEKFADVSSLYNKYVHIALFGEANTPIFDPSTGEFKKEAKTAYLQAMKMDGESNFLILLNDFIDVLEKNGYKLSDEVEEFMTSMSQSF